MAMKVRKGSTQAHNMLVIGSVLQTICLLAYAGVGKFEGESCKADN
jgi:hypothetical protein